MKLLKVAQVAEILELDVQTVRRYFRNRVFPGAFRIKAEWRLEEKDLQAFIDKRKEDWLGNQANFEDRDSIITKKLAKLKKRPDYISADDTQKATMRLAITNSFQKPGTTVAANFIYPENQDNRND